MYIHEYMVYTSKKIEGQCYTQAALQSTVQPYSQIYRNTSVVGIENHSKRYASAPLALA